MVWDLSSGALWIGKVLGPGLDFVDSKAGPATAPVLTNSNDAALQPCCPVHDLARVVELTERMGP